MRKENIKEIVRNTWENMSFPEDYEKRYQAYEEKILNGADEFTLNEFENHVVNLIKEVYGKHGTVFTEGNDDSVYVPFLNALAMHIHEG